MSFDEEIIGSDRLAHDLGCSETTLEEMHRTKELVGLRLGKGGLVYPREALLEQLNAMVRRELPGPNFDPAAPRSLPIGYAVSPAGRRVPPSLGIVQ